MSVAEPASDVGAAVIPKKEVIELNSEEIEATGHTQCDMWAANSGVIIESGVADAYLEQAGQGREKELASLIRSKYHVLYGKADKIEKEGTWQWVIDECKKRGHTWVVGKDFHYLRKSKWPGIKSDALRRYVEERVTGKERMTKLDKYVLEIISPDAVQTAMRQAAVKLYEGEFIPPLPIGRETVNTYSSSVRMHQQHSLQCPPLSKEVLSNCTVPASDSAWDQPDELDAAIILDPSLVASGSATNSPYCSISRDSAPYGEMRPPPPTYIKGVTQRLDTYSGPLQLFEPGRRNEISGTRLAPYLQAAGNKHHRERQLQQQPAENGHQSPYSRSDAHDEQVARVERRMHLKASLKMLNAQAEYYRLKSDLVRQQIELAKTELSVLQQCVPQ